jgi:hypothetical protein
MHRDELVPQLHSLSPEGRRDEFNSMEQNLPHSGFASAEIEQVVLEEVERRAAAYERGEVQTVDAFKALRELQEKLQSSRATP